MHIQVAGRAQGDISSDGDQGLRAHNVRVSPDRCSEPEAGTHEAGENPLMRTVRALPGQLIRQGTALAHLPAWVPSAWQCSFQEVSLLVRRMMLACWLMQNEI